MAYINGSYIATIEIAFKVNEADTDISYSEIKRRMRSYTSKLGELIESKANYGKHSMIKVSEQKAKVWRTET